MLVKEINILHKGSKYTDERGKLLYNNDFNTLSLGIKRIYVIENRDTHFVRAWQGHKIEQRWFSAVMGSFKIKLIKIDNWESPDKNLMKEEFILNNETLDILHVPKGYMSSIQALEPNSKLLVMADFLAGEVKDEYRLPADYFDK